MLAVAACAAYAATVLSRAGGHALPRAPYAAALLRTAGAAILASIAAETVPSAVNPRASRLKDARDRQAGQPGDCTGQSFTVTGAAAAMLTAMAGRDRFRIASVVCLCFFLPAIPGSVTKIIAYRKTFPQW
jgi:hypothetical protein